MLVIEIALHAITAWACDYYLHRMVPMLDRRVVEWVDRVVGNFPPFPCRRVQGGRLHLSHIIRGLQDVLLGPKAHRRRTYPYDNGTPSYEMGWDATTRGTSLHFPSSNPAGSGREREKKVSPRPT